MRYGYKFHGPKQIKLNVTDGAAARSRIMDNANQSNENKYETKLAYIHCRRRARARRLRFCRAPRRIWRMPRWLTRSGLCHGTFNQGLGPDGRPTVEGPTAARSGPAADHRDSQGRDGKNLRHHGQNGVADPSDPDAGPAKEIRRAAKGAPGHAQRHPGVAQRDGRITFRAIRGKMAAGGNGPPPFCCSVTLHSMNRNSKAPVATSA